MINVVVFDDGVLDVSCNFTVQEFLPKCLICSKKQTEENEIEKD